MKLINQSFEIIEQPSGLEGMYKQIELVGRVSHKSEDRITENSSKEFVDRMIKLGHGAVLEHGTVYLSSSDGFAGGFHLIRRKYEKNPYSKVKIIHSFMTGIDHIYISTNLRVLIENDWLDDLQYLCDPTEFHEKRACVKFICDRSISHEFVRHKIFCVA